MKEFAVALVKEDRTLGAKCPVAVNEDIWQRAQRGDEWALKIVGQIVLSGVAACEKAVVDEAVGQAEKVTA